MLVREIAHDRPDEMAAAVATQIAADLRHRLLLTENNATLVVPGGTTPAPIFLRLRIQNLDWRRVLIIPSDERWLAPPHDDSNETLIRNQLLQNQADQADYFSLYRPTTLPSQAEQSLDESFHAEADNEPIVMLGMGEDGHFASLFPGSARLDQGLDLNGKSYVMGFDAPYKGHPRISLTMAYLAKAKRIFLVFKGEAKRKVIDQPEGLPIEALLRQNKTDIEIHWVP